METSLIGKALNFGFNEYGFESHVSKINYTHDTAYLINQIKIGMLHKKMHLTVLYTTNIFFLLKFLKKIKYIHFFHLLKNQKKLIQIYPFYQKNLSHLQYLKIMIKPSHSLFISLRALHLIKKRTDAFNLLISTSHGLVTHSEAIRKQISGHIFGYLYI